MAAAANTADMDENQQQSGSGPVLSPLSGAYLLIILGEPISEQHKGKMLQKLRQGSYQSISIDRRKINCNLKSTTLNPYVRVLAENLQSTLSEKMAQSVVKFPFLVPKCNEKRENT